MAKILKKADKLLLNGSGSAVLLAFQMSVLLPLRLIKWGLTEVMKIKTKRKINWQYRRNIFAQSPVLRSFDKSGGMAISYVIQVLYVFINISLFVMFLKYKKLGFLVLALIFTLSLLVPFGIVPSWVRFMIRFKSYLSLKEYIGVVKCKITHLL